MTTLATFVPAVHFADLSYNTLTGCLERLDGKTRPVSMDYIEQTYGQAVLDDVMDRAPHWLLARRPSPEPFAA